jgi:NitT/TauT family transport system substrate-binding protein
MIAFSTLARALAMTALIGANAAYAEKARIGVLRTAGAGPMYIALEKGYFAREGLEAEIITFDNSQTLAVSIASGDLDFGATSLSIGFYNLAARGVLRIIAAQGRDAPGFPNNGYVVSIGAWEKGLRSFMDLPGHSVGLPTPGSGPHYAAGLIAEKYGFPMSAIDIQWTKSSANLTVALASNRIDAGVTPSINTLSMVKAGQAKLLGWVGDETPWQLGAAYTSTKSADTRQPFVEKFLRAYKTGMRDYHDAFITADGKRLDGSTAEEMLAIMSKALDQPAELLRQGITYVDRDARLEARDISRQIAWHKAQGLLEGDVEAAALMDKRYARFLDE